MTERTKKRAQFLIDTAYVAVIALLVFIAVKYVAGWILPFIVAFCISTAIHPLVIRLVKYLNIKQEIISVVVIALIYMLAGTLLFLLILQIVFTIRDGLELLPGYYDSTIKPLVLSLGTSFSAFIRDLPEPWRVQAESIQGDLINTAQSMLINVSQRGISALSGLTANAPAFVIALLFTIMLSFFISMQYDKIISFFKSQLPPRVLKIIRDTRLIIADTVIKYIRAALTLMFITFAELAIGLLILGSKNAIPVAAGIAVFDALPFFGTGTIIIPWAFIELVHGNLPFAAGLAILYAITVIVRNIIEPKIVSDKLGLNPVVSLVSIYLGYKIFGVLGMIIMPVLTQIALELHRKGSIKPFRETIANDSES